MTRVPVVGITVVLAAVGVFAFVHVKTTQLPPPRNVVPADRIAKAAARTSSTSSFTFTYHAMLSGAGDSLELHGDGSSDRERRLLAASVQLDPLPGVNVDRLRADVVLDRSDGFVEYLRTPSLGDKLPAGKSWLKLDARELGRAKGVGLDELRQGDDADPEVLFRFMRHADHPQLLGHETIGGVRTTHYSAGVDLRRLVATESDAVLRDELRRALEVPGETETLYPADAWIDGKGYLRRVQVMFPERIPELIPHGVVTITMTEEFSSFGTGVHIVVPPEASVVDVAALVPHPTLA